MDFANHMILLAAVLFLASILATVITPRLGVPLLLVFLLIGVLAGEDGPGKIQFSDYPLANLAGVAALAVILFDGGMRTRMDDFRIALKPALSLASFGVLITAGIVGCFAAWLLQLHWAEGLLIGAIVASTDAAAVFSLLHNNAVHLNKRVTSVLEIESGSNDPMAILLTLVLIAYLQQPDAFGALDTLWMLLLQGGLGVAFGIGGGRVLVRAINRLELSDSLYPLLALFGGLLIFGMTAVLGGSGFLAAYLAGITLANSRLRAVASIRRFHDGIAWMAQIGMFVILGLLASPHKLWPVAVPGLLIAAVLILVARPLAVWLGLLPFSFPWREQVFISWVGLRGSVPIVLATYPWLAGLEHAALFFNIAFFIVLVSLLVQGWTVAPAARLLGLQMPASSALVQRLELDLPGQRGYEIVSYRIGADSSLVGLRHKQLPLADASRLIGVSRAGRLLPYRDWGPMQAGDYVSLLASEQQLPQLDELFRTSRKPEREAEQRYFGEFHLDPGARMADIAEAYGVPPPTGAAELDVRGVFAKYLPNAVVGDRLRLGDIDLVVRRMERDRIVDVGLRLPHE